MSDYIRINNIDLCVGSENGCALPFIDEACIIIHDGVIEYAGAASDAPPLINDEEIIDGHRCLAIPALANAHTHAAMTLLRGAGSDLNLHDWLTTAIFPAEDRLTAGFCRTGATLGFMEMLRFGVSACADMYMFMDASGEAAAATGIRAVLARSIVGGEDGDGGRLAESVAMAKAWHGAEHGRIRAMMAPHAEYTSTPAIIRAIRDTAVELGLGVHVHISETHAEVEGCRQRRNGLTPPAYFASLGLFDVPTLAAHCVALTEDDMDILAAHNVAVCHNPVSNLKLASGVSDVPQLLRKGVSVCLGTDGAASNNNLNLWEELRLMSILHKGVTGDPCVISPAQTFHASTLAGMRAMGYNKVGLLKTGWRADIALIDRSGPHHQPLIDPAADLVYSTQGSDVRLTMVDGIIRYHDGQWPGIDAQAVYNAASVASRMMLGA
ncbi:5-methylthioadenosine/S-adenosylhomocysteine deaminase [Clostridia bacterium]|nr:5-methylthioadenosine/S-adenosylhomocysteine deaminase [Clostridia bacterium]